MCSFPQLVVSIAGHPSWTQIVQVGIFAPSKPDVHRFPLLQTIIGDDFGIIWGTQTFGVNCCWQPSGLFDWGLHSKSPWSSDLPWINAWLLAKKQNIDPYINITNPQTDERSHEKQPLHVSHKWHSKAPLRTTAFKDVHRGRCEAGDMNHHGGRRLYL